MCSSLLAFVGKGALRLWYGSRRPRPRGQNRAGVSIALAAQIETLQGWCASGDSATHLPGLVFRSGKEVYRHGW